MDTRNVKGIAVGVWLLWIAMFPTHLYAANVALVTAYIERGTAADGTPTGPGVAACPWWLAFGTRVAIQSLGAFTCHDRYRFGLSDRFDCWMPTLAEAYAVTGYYEWEVAR